MEEKVTKANVVVEVHWRDTYLDKDTAQEYVDMMNGISYACHHYDEFSEGNRNRLAVDITVGSHKLGLDPFRMLDRFIDAGLIDPNRDDEDTEKRISNVLLYEKRFTWDWMIDPDEYVGYCHDFVYDPSELPLSFELV